MMRRGLWLAAATLLVAVVATSGAMPAANAASSDWDEAWDAPPAAVYTADPTFTSTFLYKSCDAQLCTIDQISGSIVGGPTIDGCTLPSIGAVVYGTDPATWGTARSVTDSPHFTCNGTYTITRAAHAQSPHRVCNEFNPCDLGWSDDLTATFNIAIPPAAPDGVTATGDGGSVTVVWQAIADPAPDFAGYRVSRVDAGGHRVPVADKLTTGTSFVDANVPSGDYTYVVQALRAGPDGQLVTSTDASSAALTVVAPPPTTPSTDSSSSSNGNGSGIVVRNSGSRSGGSPSHSTSGTTQDPSVVGDEGFSTDLPYEAEPGEVEARPSVRTRDPKPGAGILVPTAVAAVLVVWAMHILYVTRQARWANAGLLPIEVEPTGDVPPSSLAADDDWLAMVVAGPSTRRGGYDAYRFDDVD